jgi:hypothetical protein
VARMTAWFDTVKACVGWDLADQERVAELRNWLNSDRQELVEYLGQQLAQCKGAQALMSNKRFVRRLHGTLDEWLAGLLEGAFEGERAQERRAFGTGLPERDLTFNDVILLEGLVRSRLFELARRRLGEEAEALTATMRSLDKALNLDSALLYSGYLEVRDAELERTLLDRFLTVTGFSRTLYEHLVEARNNGVAEVARAG